MSEIGGIRLNETNRQGMTPIDVAVEVKQK